jgi:iron-sulfur cluster assembly protein
MAVTVTETAAREVWQILKQQSLDPKTTCLRVGVKGGGCSGFSYLLDLTENQRDTDELWEFSYEFQPAGAGAAEAGGEGSAESFTLRVVCDPKSYLYLNGTVVDFKDELMGRGFVFNNPNATSTCGCGSSFGA